MRLTLVILTLLLAITNTARAANQLKFRFGRTRIEFAVTVEVFSPRGLKVSIPHKNGLEIFSFHGKINSGSHDVDNVTFAQDITRETNGQWVFVDRDVQLQVGDTLLFWIFLQYRGSGQRFNDLSHTVRDFTPGQFRQTQIEGSASYESAEVKPDYDQLPVKSLNRPLPPPKASWITTTVAPFIVARPAPAQAANSPDKQTCSCDESAFKDLWAQMNASATRMHMLDDSLSPLKDKIISLTETVDELIKNLNVGTNLLLTGNLPVHTNPVEDVRYLLIEKLKLQDISTNILQAEYKSNGIAFEVASSIDKLRILKRSKDILSKLSYQIIDPDRPPFDVRNAK